jgi:SNF2 family DNA or RNA helicase
VVADESTKLKGHKTLQSKNAFQIAQTIPHRLIMTGSPIMNNPLDLYGQFRFLNPYIFGQSFYKFRSQYAIMGGYMNYQVRKWINMDRLKATMNQHCCIYFKKDCLDLPDKLYEVVRVDMTEEQTKLYNELKQSFIAEFKGHTIQAAVILTRMVRFSQITAGFTKSIEEEEVLFEKNPKLEWFEEFLSELSEDKKIIVFCRFIKEISQLQALCDRLSIRYAAIWGATQNRQDQINMFNLQKDCRIFIGQIQTAGLGINLTAASYVIYLTNSYSYGDRIQSEDRAHRIGQDKNVTYIDIICRNSIDELVYKALQNKKSIADWILDKQVEEII